MHAVWGEMGNMRCPLVSFELPEQSAAASIKDLHVQDSLHALTLVWTASVV